MIPYGKQDINQSDIDAVVDVLLSDYLTQGPKVPAFESAVASYCSARYGVAVNSATSALHIACLALGVGPNDLVWTSPISFVASANCALYCGAEIDFVDVDPLTGNLCPNALAIKLEQAARIGKLPKVVIPVHLCGHSCDMAAIAALAETYCFKVIEDASHGIGGSYRGYPLGSCLYSDITVFSFHPVKIITSAEGGMALTNSPELAEKMALYRSHGITKAPDKMLRPHEGDWYYEQHSLGFNYRMTELQASLGLSQISRIDEFVQTRNSLASNYMSLLDDLSIKFVAPSNVTYSAYHLFIIILNDTEKRRMIFDEMRQAGITVHVHYYPIHLQPFYLKKGFKEGDYPNAELYYKSCLTLPLYPKLKNDELEYIVKKLSSLIKM
ncbi:UDP-4-amino-4,6-dideoxy-N-acetyl-beta-L-altrosamine transaminase [Shewanella decolorationis]|uniref:Polysaccharide biosynthesis protein n=1 Tax=Shewanella decolorationis S12 TaxID=1353536 RepID=A0ABP2Z6Q3_9GAMM|nr:UDP-4-amino-4,6-dideoxy-N-acetyl-beta-L-altrosamine transaminase [Shewanella decolorationis]ESE41164.1 polysaccharide biosynthesis protein [Shewanella decolorationis S12]GLR31584.1 UDP-4-amino-4,6-dideoxy-N-acetyl-beta-L-altrosami ne transaminase [Shewanella decolorationis]